MKLAFNFPTHFRVSGQFRVDSNGLRAVEIQPAPTRGVLLTFKSAMGTSEGAPGEVDTFKLTLPRAADGLSNTLKPTVEATYDRLSLADDKAARVRDAIEASNVGYRAEVDWGHGTLRVMPKTVPAWVDGEAARVAAAFKSKFDSARANGQPSLVSRTATEDIPFAADADELAALRSALEPALAAKGFSLQRFDAFSGQFPSVMITALAK